jgi:hypothetical protein
MVSHKTLYKPLYSLHVDNKLQLDAIDWFWKVQMIGSEPQPLLIASSTTKKPQKTKKERMKELNAAWRPLADLVSNSEVESNSLIELITDKFRQASLGMTSFLNKGKGKSNDRYALEDGDKLLANPPLKNQNNARYEPSAIACPSTKSNKKASRAAAKSKKQKESTNSKHKRGLI